MSAPNDHLSDKRTLLLLHRIGSSRWAKNPFRKSGIQRPGGRNGIGPSLEEYSMMLRISQARMSPEYREGDSAVRLG
jgi:hypothetical protein